jgi:hypothetical protein
MAPVSDWQVIFVRMDAPRAIKRAGDLESGLPLRGELWERNQRRVLKP